MIDLKPACAEMITVLQGIADDQLRNATPCSDYDLDALVDHVDDVSQGFAALARKQSSEATLADRSDGWRDVVSARVGDLGEAWDTSAAWEGSSDGGVELPNELWGKIALTEIVVHGWDIAQATSQPFDLPVDTLRACLEHVEVFVPNAPVPELWGPPVDVPADAPLIDRIVAITGRKP